jgi:hypothetical protein
MFSTNLIFKGVVFKMFSTKLIVFKGEEALLRRVRQTVPASRDLEGASDPASADETVQRRFSLGDRGK